MTVKEIYRLYPRRKDFKNIKAWRKKSRSIFIECMKMAVDDVANNVAAVEFPGRKRIWGIEMAMVTNREAIKKFLLADAFSEYDFFASGQMLQVPVLFWDGMASQIYNRIMIRFPAEKLRKIVENCNNGVIYTNNRKHVYEYIPRLMEMFEEFSERQIRSIINHGYRFICSKYMTNDMDFQILDDKGSLIIFFGRKLRVDDEEALEDYRMPCVKRNWHKSKITDVRKEPPFASYFFAMTKEEYRKYVSLSEIDRRWHSIGSKVLYRTLKDSMIANPKHRFFFEIVGKYCNFPFVKVNVLPMDKVRLVMSKPPMRMRALLASKFKKVLYE